MYIKRLLRILNIVFYFIVISTICSCSTNAPLGNYAENSANVKEVIRWGGILSTADGTIEKAFRKVATEYQKIKPDTEVKIEFLNADDYSHNRTWIVTQLVGGTAPDIMQTWHTWAKEDYRKGLVIDLKPYLNEEYEYGDKGRTWIQHFQPELISQSRDNTTGKFPSVPLASVAVKVIYNKALFNKAGIERLPATMTDMLKCCELLERADITPFIIPNASPGDDVVNWIHRMFMDQMIEPLIPSIDLDSSGYIEMNEIIAGVDKGIIDLEKSPWSNSPELIKDFSRYWIKDFNGLDRKTAVDLFIKGKGAMIIEWGFSLKAISENREREFEFGVFSFPYLTKNESEYAVGKLYEMGGAPQLNMCVPATVEKESLETVINLLQFLSSPQAANILAEEGWMVSSLQNIPLPQGLGDFVIKGSTSRLRLLSPLVSKELYEDDNRFSQLYLEGKISLSEFNAALNNDLKDFVKEQKKLNNWTESNNWGVN